MMKKDVASIREDFKKGRLDKTHVCSDPIEQFEKWMHDVLDSSIQEPTAMILATADQHGQPSSRTVLLKGVSKEGFVFYTNYNSSKGKELNENPKAALTFFWKELERQVNITGLVHKVSPEESDTYFASRPRKSRLGAHASDQSQELKNREVLMTKFAKLSLKYAGRDIPRPANWGGYILIPDKIEFWQGRPSRLHDRIEYRRTDQTAWEIIRLSP